VTLTVTGHGLAVTDGAVKATLDPAGANNGIVVTAVSGILSGEYSVEILAPSALDEIDVSLVGKKFTVSPLSDSRILVTGTISPDATGAMVNAGIPEIDGNGIEAYSTDGNQEAPASGRWNRLFWSPFDAIRYVSYVDGVYDCEWGSLDGGSDSVPTINIWEATNWIAVGTETGTPLFGQLDSSAAQVITAMNATGAFSAVMTASNAEGSDGSGEIAAVPETFLFGSTSGAAAYLGIEGLGFVTTNPNGVRLVTPTGANTLTFPLTGANETYTASGDVVRSVIDDFATEELLGACLFSDPSSNNDESIFLAYGLEVKRVKLSDGTVTSIGLPGAETIDSEVHIVQAMDKVLIFRPGLVAMEWQTGDTDFALVPSGAYAQPQILESTAAAAASGLVTFTVVGNTTIAVGDWITIYSTTDARFTSFVGRQFECVSITSTTSVVLYMPIANSTSAASATQVGRRVSVGGGYIHQPGFPWAIYFQRRIWGPYQYSWDTTLTPDAFKDRNVRDELIAGDILDSDTFDAISNQFRITGGVADYLVSLHPFFDDTLLVFMRNSIHSISGTVGSLLDASVRELTREIGCVARKSVVSQGNSVFFLSDNGVYGLEFQDLYNLRGIERPLSENIQPLIDRISRDLASGAVAAYFDNRYWLAVPLDTLPRQGDATGNNAILVYNLLNREWESLDTFSDPAFIITDLLIGSAGARNDLYAVTHAGGIHILDSLDGAQDRIASSPSTGAQIFPIDSTMTSRGFMCQTMERKRFAEIGVQMKSGVDFSDVGVSFSSDDPDSAGSEVAASSTIGGYIEGGNTADIRSRIGGERGQSGSITVRRIAGRPQIRGVKVSATVSNRAVISQK
jgi:hypothetical protein